MDFLDYLEVDNPTSRVEFAVNLSAVLIFIVISVFLLIIFKILSKNENIESKKQDRSKKDKYINFVVIISIIYSLYASIVEAVYGGFAVNLSSVLFFMIIGVLLLIIFKILRKHENTQSKEHDKNKKYKYVKFVVIAGIIYFLYELIVEKVYAIMAMSIWYFGINQIILSCFGIFITNCIIALVFDKKNGKELLCKIVIDTLYESMLFVILTSISIIMKINFSLAVIGVVILKILRNFFNKRSIIEKICIILLYAICMSFVSKYGSGISVTRITEPGKIIIREIEEYTNKKYRRYENIRITNRY